MASTSKGRTSLSVLSDLAKYDLVWIYGMRTADVMGQWHWPRTVMDIDDVPSTFLQTEREYSQGFTQRLRTDLRLRIAKKREFLLRERFPCLVVSSETDRRHLGPGMPAHVVPNGFPTPDHDPLRRPAIPPRIGFIGTFYHPPNPEAARWFAEHCWPRVKKEIPDARFRLIGQLSDGPEKPAGNDIDGLGFCEDVAAEIATWSVMVVPVRTGSGTRIKIVEGFSRKCPIVSTRVGAYGYDAEHGREMLLADSAEDFEMRASD